MEKVKEEKGFVAATAFRELGEIINRAQISKRYFGKSQGWFSQRLNGCLVSKKKRTFNEKEFVILSGAFRDLSDKLRMYADRIDSADYENTKRE